MSLLLHKKKKGRPCGAPVLNGTCPRMVTADFVCFYHPTYNDEQQQDDEPGQLTFAERLEAGTRGDRPKLGEIFSAMRDRGRAA